MEDNKWISVEDELPQISKSDDLHKVLIYCNSIQETIGYYWGTELDKPCKGWCIAGVTHWQPLPAPPTTQEGDKK